jgi:hypothetical protein
LVDLVPSPRPSPQGEGEVLCGFGNWVLVLGKGCFCCHKKGRASGEALPFWGQRSGRSHLSFCRHVEALPLVWMCLLEFAIGRLRFSGEHREKSNLWCSSSRIGTHLLEVPPLADPNWAPILLLDKALLLGCIVLQYCPTKLSYNISRI